MWTSGYSFWKATTIGASSESEMLGGAASRRFPETFERWLEAMLSIASRISAPRCAYSSTSEPTSVRRNERVERSIRRTPSACSSSAMRRLTVFSALWQADGSKVRRCAPMDFIGRHLKGFFDYGLADEVHENKGYGTGDRFGNAVD